MVLTSFSSETLDAAIDATNSDHANAVAHIQTMLAASDYDASDMHLYACVDTIQSKIEFVTSRLPAGKPWIATENGGSDPRCASTPGDWASDPQGYEQLKAERVPQRLGACAQAGGTICLRFSLYDVLQASDVFSHMGLLDPSVTPPREKPAYGAFRSFVESQEEPRARRHLYRSR